MKPDQSNMVQTYTGKIFDFQNIETNEIDIDDIAHALSNQCRWSGHSVAFFSTAQHSCNVYDRILYATQDYKLAGEGLLHDGPESWFLDVSRPLKRNIDNHEALKDELRKYVPSELLDSIFIKYPDYGALLKRGEHYIMGQFGYSGEMSPEVAEVDNRMLSTEYVQLIDLYSEVRLQAMVKFMRMFPPYERKTEVDVANNCWTPHRAESEFLTRFATWLKWARENGHEVKASV